MVAYLFGCLLRTTDQKSALRCGLRIKLRTRHGRVAPLPANFGEGVRIARKKLIARLLAGIGYVTWRVYTHF